MAIAPQYQEERERLRERERDGWMDGEGYPSPVDGRSYAGPLDLTRGHPADRDEGPALDRTEIRLLLRINPLAATTAADVVAAAPDAPPSSSGKLPIYAYGRPSANCAFGRRSTCGQGLKDDPSAKHVYGRRSTCGLGRKDDPSAKHVYGMAVRAPAAEGRGGSRCRMRDGL